MYQSRRVSNVLPHHIKQIKNPGENKIHQSTYNIQLDGKLSQFVIVYSEECIRIKQKTISN